MRVILSIGGSVLAPDLDADRVDAHADVLDGLVDDGHEVAAVVGGGGVARRYLATSGRPSTTSTLSESM